MVVGEESRFLVVICVVSVCCVIFRDVFSCMVLVGFMLGIVVIFLSEVLVRWVRLLLKCCNRLWVRFMVFLFLMLMCRKMVSSLVFDSVFGLSLSKCLWGCLCLG